MQRHATLGLLASLFFSACASRPPLGTVPEVDLEKYAGRWHEIARYPNWFERGLGDVTAVYTPLSDGRIRVENTGYTSEGKKKTVRGHARVVPDSGNAKLKVHFGGPFAGAYWIIALDEKDYQWAIVGHPSRQFLWILARDPDMPASQLDGLYTLAAEKGYRVEKIEKTPRFDPARAE